MLAKYKHVPRALTYFNQVILEGRLRSPSCKPLGAPDLQRTSTPRWFVLVLMMRRWILEPSSLGKSRYSTLERDHTGLLLGE